MGGYIYYNNYSENFRSYLNDPDNWDARLDGPGRKNGVGDIRYTTFLSPKTGLPLATGAVRPDYSIEEIFIGGRVLSGLGIAKILVQDYRYLSTIRQLGFKELQVFTKAHYSDEMNLFFKSQGVETISRRALLTYRELIIRILNTTGGAPAAKASAAAVVVQTQRLNMINKALALF